MLLADEVDDRATLNTIMHELLHTVLSCLNHNGKWKVYAELVNRRLPKYNIKRVAKESETGIIVERKTPVYRYILRCTKCGQEIKRQKETKELAFIVMQVLFLLILYYFVRIGCSF